MKGKVGIIGAGNIGFGMSVNLLKAGFEVVVFDKRADPLKELEQKGAKIAESIGAVGSECPVVFSVVLNYEQNLNVFKGPDGLLENMKSGSTVFVNSTISPAHAVSLSELAAEKGISFCDCPVSGGYEGAMAGTLALMVGGEKQVVDTHRPILEAVGAKVYHMGGIGTGEAAKAVNQILVSVHCAAAAEAMLLAAKSGIDLNTMYDIVCHSAGQSWMFEHRADRMINRDFRSRGILGILLKDTKILLETAAAHGLVLPLSTATSQLFQAGVNKGIADEDDAAVVKVLEDLAGFSLDDVKS